MYFSSKVTKRPQKLLLLTLSLLKKKFELSIKIFTIYVRKSRGHLKCFRKRALSYIIDRVLQPPPRSINFLQICSHFLKIIFGGKFTFSTVTGQTFRSLEQIFAYAMLTSEIGNWVMFIFQVFENPKPASCAT